VIIEVSKIFSEFIREIDFASRYGGDEFIAILPQADAKMAAKIADRIRRMIENHNFNFDNVLVKVTLSIGIIEFNKEFVYYNENIIEAVDDALYFSKQSGRNRVSIGSYSSIPVLFS